MYAACASASVCAAACATSVHVECERCVNVGNGGNTSRAFTTAELGNFIAAASRGLVASCTAEVVKKKKFKKNS